jgi:hypothetical protein
LGDFSLATELAWSILLQINKKTYETLLFIMQVFVFVEIIDKLLSLLWTKRRYNIEKINFKQLGFKEHFMCYGEVSFVIFLSSL